MEAVIVYLKGVARKTHINTCKGLRGGAGHPKYPIDHNSVVVKGAILKVIRGKMAKRALEI